MKLIFALLLIFSTTIAFAQLNQQNQAKLKELQENLCAEVPEKTQTEAVGACPECVKQAQKDSATNKKIDTSVEEARQRDLQFLRAMRDTGRLRGVRAFSCPSVSQCEEELQKIDGEVAVEKKAYEDATQVIKAYLDSDVTKTPMPKGPLTSQILNKLYQNTNKGENYLSKVERTYELRLKNPETTLDPELLADFTDQAKKIFDQGFSPSNSHTIRIFHAKISLETWKEKEKKLSTADELQLLEKWANEGINDRLATQPGFQRCGMTPAEIFSVKHYTEVGFRRLNGDLRAGGDLEPEQKVFKEVLSSALSKLRKYDGFVDRGVDFPTAIMDKYQVGAIIDSPAFTSAGAFSGFNRNQKFVIKSKTGVFIAPFSTSYHEHEVLIPAGVKFKVLERKVHSAGSIQIVMEEVDP